MAETIQRLSVSDFNIDDKDMITLKNNNCMIVLFYGDNDASITLGEVFATVAQQIAGPIFASVNVSKEKDIALAFTKVRSDINHPLNWAGIREFPFILVYRSNWPVALYGGAKTVPELMNYALNMACRSDYFER